MIAAPTTQKPGAQRIRKPAQRQRQEESDDSESWGYTPLDEVGEGDRPKTKKPGSGR